MNIRLLGITQGSISDPMASSGDNHSIFSALARQVDLIDTLDVSLRGWRRYFNAATHWRSDRDRWREAYDQNMWSFRELSRLAGKLIEQKQGQFDVLLQMKTIFAPGLPPGKWPYFIITDNTYALSDRLYPPWAPMGRAEKAKWFAIEKETYQRAEAVFARTSWLRRSLLEDYGLAPEKVVMVGTGTNFAVDALPTQKTPDDGRTILFVGKEMERKGVPTLLEAFKIVRQRVPDARLVLVGRDANIAQAGVEVLGKISDRSRLRQVYEAATVFVLPSIFEPNGNVVVEAMGYHLPCIVSTGGGLADHVIEGETGYIVPPRQPGVLAERIIDLLGDEAKRSRMGAASAQRVREFYSWDCVVERMMPHLAAAVQSGSSAQQEAASYA